MLLGPPWPTQLQCHDTGDPEAEPQDLAEVRVWNLVKRRGHRLDDHSRIRARGREAVEYYSYIIIITIIIIIID